MDGITIAELAESIHMNPSYLCTLFKKAYGITISDKLNELQRERACQLLATSDLPMGEIAYQTGESQRIQFRAVVPQSGGDDAWRISASGSWQA